MTPHHSLIKFASASFAIVCVIASAAQPVTSAPTGVLPAQAAVSVALNCGGDWNPACAPTATSVTGLKLTSYFYIDGRSRGAANKTYTNVCATFRLRDGWHSARVYARDSKGKTASTGTVAKAVRCDRTAPRGSPGVTTSRGIVRANPTASDSSSGLAAKSFHVDLYERDWKAYANVCRDLSLWKGMHTARVTVRDAAGNATNVTQRFRCP